MGRRLLILAGSLLALGCVPSCGMPTNPGKIINLPIADRASDAKTDAEATIEISLEDAKDLGAVEKRIHSVLGGIRGRKNAARLDLPPVTLRLDRGLKYRELASAMTAAVQEGFPSYLLACSKSGTSAEVGYLAIKVPHGLPDQIPGSIDGRPFELRVMLDGHFETNIFGNPTGERFDSIAAVLPALTREAHDESKPYLIIRCPADLPLQQFVDAYSAGLKAGFAEIALGVPDWEN